MPIERAVDHPIFELGTTTITSFAAPARDSEEVALYHADVTAGGGVLHLGDDGSDIAARDPVVVPVGVRHHLEAGSAGASIVVAMLTGTRPFRDDDSMIVPEWVS